MLALTSVDSDQSVLAETFGASTLSACELCPRHCKADRLSGDYGICGADSFVEIGRAALHFWEEPPLSGESGSGTIFFTHCPLHCVYCQNASLASGLVGRRISINRLAEICLELQDQAALNINCVTPTHYTPQIILAIKKARDQGLELPVIWNTSGYEALPTIQVLKNTVDVYLTDFKYTSPDLAQAYSQAPDYPTVAAQALAAMVNQVGEPRFDRYQNQERMARGVIVRHLILPGALEDSKRVVAYLAAEYGSAIRVSLMNQYTPLLEDLRSQGDKRATEILERFPVLAHTVSNEDYERLLDYADTLGLEDYYWQEGGAVSESFIPDFDLTGVLKAQSHPVSQ